MIHLRDNFGGGPVSQVPASWFNAVAKFINNLVPGEGIRFEKHADGNATIIRSEMSGEMGTPVDNTEASNEDDDPEASTLTFENWESGGNNGVKLRLYALVDSATYSGSHLFFPIDFEIAANGIVKSVKAPTGDHGIFIGA